MKIKMADENKQKQEKKKVRAVFLLSNVNNSPKFEKNDIAVLQQGVDALFRSNVSIFELQEVRQ